MNRLLDYADAYLLESDWKTMTALKFCLCALGVMIGMLLPKQFKRPVLIGAFAVFIATYIPLMAKLFKVVRYYSDGFKD